MGGGELLGVPPLHVFFTCNLAKDTRIGHRNAVVGVHTNDLAQDTRAFQNILRLILSQLSTAIPLQWRWHPSTADYFRPLGFDYRSHFIRN